MDSTGVMMAKAHVVVPCPRQNSVQIIIANDELAAVAA